MKRLEVSPHKFKILNDTKELARWTMHHVTDCEPKYHSFFAGKPHLVSDQQLKCASRVLNYYLAPDGKRFAVFPNLNARAEEKCYP